MAVLKPVGQQASAKKYDILSAMMVYGLSQDKQRQKLVMRLMSLITTRYNWRNDDLTMGHKDIARLWSVDPRTVKREMSKLRNLGWIKIKRQGARGRVSTYGICFEEILTISKPTWGLIGPDFEERAMQLLPAKTQHSKVVKVSFGSSSQAPLPRDGVWRDVRAALRAEDAPSFEAWFSRLDFIKVDQSDLVLKAPSDFVAGYIDTHLSTRLLQTAKLAYPTITSIRFEV